LEEVPRSVTFPKPAVKVRGVSVMDDDILFVIDGVMSGREALDRIAPNDIEQIDVLKDKAAVSLYGDKAKAGVIIITTKKVKKISPKETIIIKSDSISLKDMPVMIHGEMKVEEKVSIVTGNISLVKANARMAPVFYNGKNVSGVPAFKTGVGKYALASLDAKEAIAKYGTDGSNGAVEITSL
jgi:TonB-dependent SusC/RagA subfamily outer membrane receptor